MFSDKHRAKRRRLRPLGQPDSNCYPQKFASKFANFVWQAWIKFVLGGVKNIEKYIIKNIPLKKVSEAENMQNMQINRSFSILNFTLTICMPYRKKYL